MLRIIAIMSCLSLMPRMACATDDNVTRIVLLGDSSVIVSYLPPEQSPQTVLKQMLLEDKPEAKVQITNAADNGEFIARFLLSGAYERLRNSLKGAEIIVIRFGANDEKRVSPTEYGQHLERLIDLLSEDFPSAKIILETGIYMDPKHYSFDRNKTLIAYWEKVREIAAARNLPCSDVYAAMERETLGGNWDLRLRKSKTPVDMNDPAKDQGRENDMAWFSNVHPNVEGVRVACLELSRCILSTFPGDLPTGSRQTDRKPNPQEYYSALLNFSPDRLVELKAPPWRAASRRNTSGPMDDLQTPVNSLNTAPQP